MANQIVDSETKIGLKYPIQPRHINTDSHFISAFGECYTEISAMLIVSLCKEKGGWLPFTKEEIDKHTYQNFHFNGLIEQRDQKSDRNFVILGEDGKYRVTHEFIVNCFKSSPAPIV